MSDFPTGMDENYAAAGSSDYTYTFAATGGGFLSQKKAGLTTGVGGKYVDMTDPAAYGENTYSRKKTDIKVHVDGDPTTSEDDDSDEEIDQRAGKLVTSEEQVNTPAGIAAVLVFEDWTMDFKDRAMWTLGETTQTCVPGGPWAGEHMEDWSRTKGEYWSLAWNENNTKPVLTVGNTVSHGGVEVSFKYNQKIAKVVRKHNVELQEQKKAVEVEKKKVAQAWQKKKIHIEEQKQKQQMNLAMQKQKAELEMAKLQTEKEKQEAEMQAEEFRQHSEMQATKMEVQQNAKFAQQQLAMKRKQLAQQMNLEKQKKKAELDKARLKMETQKLKQNAARAEAAEMKKLEQQKAHDEAETKRYAAEVLKQQAEVDAQQAHWENQAVLEQRKKELKNAGKTKVSVRVRKIPRTPFDAASMVPQTDRSRMRLWKFGVVHVNMGQYMDHKWVKRYLILRDLVIDIQESSTTAVIATYPFGPQVKFASTKSDTCSSEGRLLGHEKPYTFELNTKMGLGKMHVDCSDMKTLTSWMHAMDEARQHQKAAGAKLAETVNWLNALYQDMEDAYEGVGDKTVDEGAKKKAAALKKKHG